MLFRRLTLRALLLLGALTVVGCDGRHDSGSSGSEDKAKGHFQEAAGSLIGSDKLKQEGQKNEVKGGVKSVVGDFKQTVRDATK